MDPVLRIFSFWTSLVDHRGSKDEAGWISDGSVLAGKGQSTGPSIHFENGNVVCTLIAHVQESTGRVETEAAGIVSPCPFFRDIGQPTIFLDGKNADAVVKPIARVYESPVL